MQVARTSFRRAILTSGTAFTLSHSASVTTVVTNSKQKMLCSRRHWHHLLSLMQGLSGRSLLVYEKAGPCSADLHLLSWQSQVRYTRSHNNILRYKFILDDATVSMTPENTMQEHLTAFGTCVLFTHTCVCVLLQAHQTRCDTSRACCCRGKRLWMSTQV